MQLSIKPSVYVWITKHLLLIRADFATLIAFEVNK